MLHNNNGEMFFPGEDWRVAIKKKAHALNQQYNLLNEDQVEQRRAICFGIL